MARVRVSKGWIAAGVVVAVMGGLLLSWQISAHRMTKDFTRELRAGRVEGLPIDLGDKVWTEQEISTVEGFTLDDSYGPQRSLERLAHTRGGYTLSPSQYSHQAVITDTSTGVRHVFGHRRVEPGGWRYVTIHPDSARRHLEQRGRGKVPGP